MGPGDLHALLQGVTAAPPGAADTRVLLGLETPDDAAVLRWDAGPAVVMTVDLITPACDDPFLFGQLAAANALSDVYAMGGTPLAVLNICCFPEDDACPAAVKRKILEGVTERVRAAGAVVVGGHTVRDAELKVGLSVVGSVAPGRVLRKAGLRAGDALVLTKPLGIGVLINAYRSDLVARRALEDALRPQVALNDRAAQVALHFGATGATDITGFGLVGHGLEMARGAGLTLELWSSQVPVLDLALEMARQGVASRGLRENRQDAGTAVDVAAGVEEARATLCFDPQTSGGLFFGVAPQDAEPCVRALHAAGMPDARVVGAAVPGPGTVNLR